MGMEHLTPSLQGTNQGEFTKGILALASVWTSHSYSFVSVCWFETFFFSTPLSPPLLPSSSPPPFFLSLLFFFFHCDRIHIAWNLRFYPYVSVCFTALSAFTLSCNCHLHSPADPFRLPLLTSVPIKHSPSTHSHLRSRQPPFSAVSANLTVCSWHSA